MQFRKMENVLQETGSIDLGGWGKGIYVTGALVKLKEFLSGNLIAVVGKLNLQIG